VKETPPRRDPIVHRRLRAPPGGRRRDVRVWAPAAERVSVRGSFNGFADHPLTRASDGQWEAFVPGAAAGDQHSSSSRTGSAGPKRILRALTSDPPFPHSNCVITRPETYPWHDA
jgi:1,4-alpha-glucan branching enzyme